MSISVSQLTTLDPERRDSLSLTSPITDHGLEGTGDLSDFNADLVENILALLDEHTSLAPSYSPAVSARYVSTPRSISQWVQKLPSNYSTATPLAISPGDTFTSNYESSHENLYVNQEESSRQLTPNPINSCEEYRTWLPRVTSLIPKVPSYESPEYPTISSSSHRSKNGLNTGLEFPAIPSRMGRNSDRMSALRRTAVSPTPLPSKKRSGSMPNMRTSVKPINPGALEAYSRKSQPIRIRTPVSNETTEFCFPLPPISTSLFPRNSSSPISINEESEISSHQNTPRVGQKNSDSLLGPSMISLVTEIEPYHKYKNLAQELKKQTESDVKDTTGHLRTKYQASPRRPATLRNSFICLDIPTPSSPIYSRRVKSALLISQGMGPDAQGLAENMQRQTGSMRKSVRDSQNLKPIISPSATNSGTNITASVEDQNLLKECLVIGVEARLLTVYRRSLTSAKVEWLVVDNGMVANVDLDGGRLLLRCFGDAVGKIDFFTAEGSSLFRFQHTSSKTWTATSLSMHDEKMYFSVRDGSWDCCAHLEVSLFSGNDEGTEKWLVSGDQQMKRLDVWQDDRIVAMIRDFGDHEVDSSFTLIVACAKYYFEIASNKLVPVSNQSLSKHKLVYSHGTSNLF
ncbi:hypothetical protein BGHDH14_bghG000209000002001 [Blumeria hordei DH14]|uniref:Uncharacterized protein n=1 Tax=Blumeria graminis f. sp. hordei (strain DH14) TaxID=546991 RepID=N1J935_BLUG1|nr:hypothetical protein BGHDH14_bghG000209000002001 [Blumeria hordei DH14]